MSQPKSVTGDEDAFKLALQELQYFSANSTSMHVVRQRIRDTQHPAAQRSSGPLKTFCNKVIRELNALHAQSAQDQSSSSTSRPNADLHSQQQMLSAPRPRGPPSKIANSHYSKRECTFTWDQMHDVRVSMPFLGSKRETQSTRYEKLGLPLNWKHPGMPEPGEELADMDYIQQEWKAMTLKETYRTPSTDIQASSIADMSRLLYHTAKVPPPDARRLNAQNFIRQQRMLLVYYIARFIQKNSDIVQEAVPIKISNKPRSSQPPSTTDHFALVVRFANNSITLIPIALWVTGSLNSPSEFHKNSSRQNFSSAFKDITSFFQDAHWPILGISDVIFTSRIVNVTNTKVWQPRVFENVWYFAHASDKVHITPQTSMHLRQPYVGWQRYTDISNLMHAVSSVSRTAQIWRPTFQPFESLTTNEISLLDIACYPPTPRTFVDSLPQPSEIDAEFELEEEFNVFHSEDAIQSNKAVLDSVNTDSIEDDMDNYDEYSASYPVDGRPSCAAFFRCISSPIPRSTLCQVHWERFVFLKTTQLPKIIQQPKASQQFGTSEPPPSFHLPTDPSMLAKLRALIHLAEISKNLWLVDTEFYTNKGMAPSTFQVCVKRYMCDNQLIDTNIHYEDFDLDACDSSWNLFFRSIFRRIYGLSNHTNGITMSQLGAQIREHGFDYRNSAIISWFSMADITAVVRALRGHNSMQEAKENVRIPNSYSTMRGFQPINIGHLVKSMVQLQSYQLSYVHLTLCPETLLFGYHLAKTDTLALEEIIAVIVREGKALLK